MTDRIWFAPAGTPAEDAVEWQEVGTVTGFQFTPDDESGASERAWGFPAGAKFTASFAAPGLFAVVGAAIKAAGQRERELAAQRVLHLEAQRITEHRLRSLFDLHQLGGGRWRYGETGPPPAPTWIQSIIDSLSADIATRRDRRRGRGGP